MLNPRYSFRPLPTHFIRPWQASPRSLQSDRSRHPPPPRTLAVRRLRSLPCLRSPSLLRKVVPAVAYSSTVVLPPLLILPSPQGARPGIAVQAALRRHPAVAPYHRHALSPARHVPPDRDAARLLPPRRKEPVLLCGSRHTPKPPAGGVSSSAPLGFSVVSFLHTPLFILVSFR